MHNACSVLEVLKGLFTLAFVFYLFFFFKHVKVTIFVCSKRAPSEICLCLPFCNHHECSPTSLPSSGENWILIYA